MTPGDKWAMGFGLALYAFMFFVALVSGWQYLIAFVAISIIAYWSSKGTTGKD